MSVLARSIGFVQRLLSGEDVVLVRQTNVHWDRQFADGKWDRLKSEQPNTARVATLVLEEAKKCAGQVSVLDIGCGNGGLTRLLANESGIEYCGTDISREAVEQARSFAPTARLLVADAAHPSQDLGTFDILIFNEVFYYFDAAAALKEYRIHAKPGARIVISVVRSWRSLFVWRRIRRVVRCIQRETLHDETHVWDIATARYP